MRWLLVTIIDGASIGIRAVVIAHFRELQEVVIEEDASIGPGAIIMPNVTIGPGAVVTSMLTRGSRKIGTFATKLPVGVGEIITSGMRK